MEEEDFGFTQRDEWVLRRIGAHGCAVEGRQEGQGGEGGDPATARGPNANGGRAPSAAKGVGATGNVAGPVTSPETGSGRPAERTRSERSVATESPTTPDIPNVVEYHLKVKPNVAKPTGDSQPGMRKEPAVPAEESKDLQSRFSRLRVNDNVFEGSTELPQIFQVKYLGSHDARGLWGIRHTRKPVDNMVAAARSLPTGTILPFIKLVVSPQGVALLPLGKRPSLDSGLSRMYTIENISYGVQDLVYTRVFSMIVVRGTGKCRETSPFECHGFVCESKHHARQLTCALAAAFQIYSQNVRALAKSEESRSNTKKRFAIDLRSPDEIEADLNLDSEA
ncbi:uncharacterized protein LOC105696349 [Orussus abietinus]|uniref:uncharacterized protein LOC105696349 n=1 Tax=Orussus abietinus TaxID=222816 RepID=UPI000625AB05|nr:uncharacterized protein LOC105696349 [Orussus abietinus]